jgi:uncharacterized protein involved in type VI secretion and phage assembly
MTALKLGTNLSRCVNVKGQLPDTKKLSGIRSQEISGSGFNQLRFDDTTQLKAFTSALARLLFFRMA